MYRRSDRRPAYKGKPRYAHVADNEEEEVPVEGGHSEEDEDEDLEQEAMLAAPGYSEEDDDEDHEIDEDEDLSTYGVDELKEAYAAGWRAKNKTAERRKGRGYKSIDRPQDHRAPDDRKRNSTCASCGQKGPWRGDAACPNVKSGKDKSHAPKVKKENLTHFTAVDRSKPPAEPRGHRRRRGSAPQSFLVLHKTTAMRR